MKKLTVLLAMVLMMGASGVRAAETDVLAVVDGKNITEKEVLMKAVETMFRTMKQDRAYNMKKGALEDMIDEMLIEKEATSKGKTADALTKEIQESAKKVTEADARVLFEIQKQRYGGQAFEEVKNDIMNQLKAQKRAIAMNDFIKGLRDKSKITVNLERPRFPVTVDDDPSQGVKGSPITLIEFSEFQCPYCKRTRPTLDKIMSEYKGKVHYVFRDFPLSFHKQAKDAANAAQCANDQKKFWEYSEELWASQGKHTPEKLIEIGEKLKLDMGKFKSCVDSKKYFAEIDKDQADGAKNGVSGTPAYFINGIFLSGAQPFSAFKEIIDEELAAKKN